MNEYFKALYRSTGQLLARVNEIGLRTGACNEIERWQLSYNGIEFTKSVQQHEDGLEKAIETLEHMKSRLVTIMEDTLYTM